MQSTSCYRLPLSSVTMHDSGKFPSAKRTHAPEPLADKGKDLIYVYA